MNNINIRFGECNILTKNRWCVVFTNIDVPSILCSCVIIFHKCDQHNHFVKFLVIIYSLCDRFRRDEHFIFSFIVISEEDCLIFICNLQENRKKNAPFDYVFAVTRHDICPGGLGPVFSRSEKELYRRQKNSSRRESLQKPDVPFEFLSCITIAVLSL